MSDSQPQIISEVQVAPAGNAARSSSMFALAIVGVVLASIALPCAGVYGLFASLSWTGDASGVLGSPFFLLAFVGTLVPAGLSFAPFYFGIRERVNNITTLAGVGMGLALLGLLIVVASSFGPLGA